MKLTTWAISLKNVSPGINNSRSQSAVSSSLTSAVVQATCFKIANITEIGVEWSQNEDLVDW